MAMKKRPKKKAIQRRKPDAARRETLIKVLTTTEERELFQAAADKLGMSVSTWMRSIALSAARPAPAAMAADS
jgi:uncharacterized protein (DUF1778 family)